MRGHRSSFLAMLVHPRDSIHNPAELVEFTLVAQKLNRCSSGCVAFRRSFLKVTPSFDHLPAVWERMNPASREEIRTLLNFHAVKSSREKFNRLKLIRFLRIFREKSKLPSCSDSALKSLLLFNFEKRAVNCVLRQIDSKTSSFYKKRMIFL